MDTPRDPRAPGLILCVCTGNICRSPMAEHILRARLGPRAGRAVASAGLHAGFGQPASAEAREALAEWGLDLSAHRSQPLTRELVDRAALIVVMTEQHRQDVRRFFPEAEGRTHLLASFGPAAPPEDIADPIGGSLAVYRAARDRINSAVSDLVLYIRDRWGLPEPPRGAGEPTMKMAIGADHGGLDLKNRLKPLLERRRIEVDDVGTHTAESVDYPDFAAEVARRVSEGEADEGLLVCTTGIGMSISANKFPGVRAALCTTPRMARMARTHNDANVLTLGAAETTPEDAEAILAEWLAGRFERGGRHERRLAKIGALAAASAGLETLREADPELLAALRAEGRRQRENLELIASENYASAAVREAQGSVLTNKYAEGYPGRRWYHGCQHVDEAERLAIERARRLFGADHANVQPHCGSAANMAVYFAVMNPGDTLMAMSLAHGGHLTHGHEVNFSGRFFRVVHYGLDPESELIDYDRLEALAIEHRPTLLCAGASAYSRILDFPRLRRIADAAGALFMVDMAHIAGLVAAGCHPNPVPYCDFVTSTTHKTLRGPRGGLILCRERFAQDIDRQVFPGLQGGPHMHVIAAKAVCLREAAEPAFQVYQRQVVANARALAAALQGQGLRIVSGGTDNHLMLVDLTAVGVTGKDAADRLDQARITVNKNAIPFDQRSPFVTSGVRVGTPAVTTRGMKEPEMEQVAAFIGRVLAAPDDEAVLAAVRAEVLNLTARFPVP